MTWNLNCRKTRRLLALSAGNDLEERDQAGAHRHLAVCPHCREVWQGLRRSQQAIEQVRAAPAVEHDATTSVWSSTSLWPAVARHIRKIDVQAAALDWRGWLPAGALAAACLAIVIVTLPDAPSGNRTAQQRDPLVVLPQQAIYGSDPSTAGPIPLRLVPDAERDRRMRRKANDEPRSF
jgi:hypothetical protein